MQRPTVSVSVANPAAQVGKVAAVPVICLAVALVGFGITLPIPLYAQYARLSGAGVGAFGIAYACYGAAILPSLFLLGGISDRIGRKLPMLAAVGLSFVAVVAVSLFPGLFGLAVSRLTQGMAIGLTGAAATPLLTETLGGDRAAERGSALVTSMIALGFAGGGLATQLSLLPGETLMPLSYALYIGIAALCMLLLRRMPYSFDRRAVAVLRVPAYPAGSVFYCAAIGAIWCLVGTTMSVVPLELSRSHLGAWIGVMTFLQPFAGLLCQGWAQRVGPLRAVRLGLMLGPSGGMLVTVGLGGGQVGLVLAGAVLIGAAGLGFSYYGGLAAVSLLAGAERARASAGFFLCCYLAVLIMPPLLGLIAAWFSMSAALIGLTVAVAVACAAMEVSCWRAVGGVARFSVGQPGS